MQLHYNKMLKWFYNNHPDKMGRFVESVSVNQLISKNLIVLMIRDYQDYPDDMVIEIIGGWFGFPLIDFLNQAFPEKIKKIKLFEKDEFACRVADRYCEYLNPDFTFDTYHMDYFNYTERRTVDLVINTSCEHMPDIAKNNHYYKRLDKMVVALQSNDMFWEADHTNCSKNLQDFIEKSKLKLYDSDELELEANQKKYKRFSLVGQW